MVLLFTRILKLEDFWNVVLPLVAQETYDEVLYRVGYLHAYDPRNSDREFRLNLVNDDHQRLTKMLVELAVVEPGENWAGEQYNDIPGWELPMSWTKEVPKRGWLNLRYTSKGRGCVANMELRAEMLERVLLGRVGP